MSYFILRSLVLASCFVLALPPGWCSLVLRERPDEVPVRAQAVCCDLCTCGENERIPTPPDGPAMPSRCCCYELNWLKPPDPVKVDLDFSFVAIIAPAVLYPTVSGVNERAITDAPTPSRRLHLLHCVWLC